MRLFYVGDVAFGSADEIDFVLSAAFGFEQGLIGLLEKLIDGSAVAGETGQSTAYGQDAFALRTQQGQLGFFQLTLETLGNEDGLCGMFSGRRTSFAFRAE